LDQDLENTVDDLELRAAHELIKEHVAAANPIDTAMAGEAPDTRFAVNAPYWLNGLHNLAGLELAEEINKVISSKKLEEEQNAIEQILAANYPDGRRFGLTVISEKKHIDEPHRKMNLAEPKSLLESAFVRDKDGAYRPAAGGRAILLDKGDSLVLKNKDAASYEAAVELAKAKGWTAIKLNGRPAMMEQAWIAAKLAGIEVTNYLPTKEAQAKFADRLAAHQLDNTVAINRVETEPSVSSGSFEGKILRFENGQAVQKTGRDPDVTVRHDISKLSKTLIVGEVATIKYDKDGHGIVEGKMQEKALTR
jgi:Large polyvalent protein-associated domain 7